MNREPREDASPAVRQLTVTGLVAVCVLALIQVLVTVLLMGRFEHVRGEIRALEGRLRDLEGGMAGPAGAPTGVASAPAVEPIADPSTGFGQAPPTDSATVPPPTENISRLRQRVTDLLAEPKAIEDPAVLQRAVAALAEAVAPPRDPTQETAVLLARGWYWLEEMDRARLWLERSGEIPADDAAGQLLAGRILLTTPGKQGEAEVALKNAMKTDATKSDAAKLLTRLYLDRQKPDQAAEFLDAVKPAENDLEYTLLRGRLAVLQNNHDQAVELLSPILDQAPDSAEAHVPETHVQLGIARLRQGELEAARKHFAQAELAAPTRPDPAYWQGVLQMRLHQNAEAIKWFERAIELDARYAPAWAYLGIALANEDRLDEAIERLNRAVEIDPDRAESFFTLAVCYARSEKPVPARAALHRALHLDAAFADKAAQVESLAKIISKDELEAMRKK